MRKQPLVDFLVLATALGWGKPNPYGENLTSIVDHTSGRKLVGDWPFHVGSVIYKGIRAT